MNPLPLPKNDTMNSDERAAAGRSRSRSTVHSSLKALVEKFDAPPDNMNTKSSPKVKKNQLRTVVEARLAKNDRAERSRSRSPTSPSRRRNAGNDAPIKTDANTSTSNVTDIPDQKEKDARTVEDFLPLRSMKSPIASQTAIESGKDPNSSGKKSSLVKNMGKAMKNFLSPNRLQKKSSSKDGVNPECMDDQIDLPPAQYQGPTKLHEVCYKASSVEELRPFCTPSSSSHLEMLDENERNPLHLLGLNRNLVQSLTYERGSDAVRLTQLSSNPGIDPNKVSDLVNFVLDLVMPNHVPQLLAEDKNGYIPFQEVFIHWIDLVEQSANATKTENITDRVKSVFRKFGSVDPSYEDTARPAEIPESDDGDDKTDTLSTTVVVDTNDRYALPPTPQMSNQEVSSRTSQSLNTASAQSLSEVELPLRVAYSLHVTSGLLDVLSELSRRADHRMKQMNDNNNLRVSRIRPQKISRSNRQLMRSNRQLMRQGNENFGLTGNMGSIVDAIEVKFASTENAIKTLLSIDDDIEREDVLDFSIVRRAMLRKESLGTWLSDMLQDSSKGVRQRAIDYLILMSDILEREKDLFQESTNAAIRMKYYRLNELYVAVGNLDGLIPSMLALDERMVEEAATTPLLTKVLDHLIKTPFVSCTLFFDTLLLLLCIFFLRKSVDDYLLGGNTTETLHWLYAVNAFAFYHTLREFSKSMALSAVAKKRDVFFNMNNFLGIISLVLLITSVLSIRMDALGLLEGKKGQLRILIATTTGMLWLKFIFLLMFINVKMATFVTAIIKITEDIFWFMVILVVIVLCFAQIFFTLLVPDPGECEQHGGAIATHDDSEDMQLRCNPKEYYLKVYSVLLGDWGLFQREVDFKDKGFGLIVFVIFTFLIAIVLLNVLIAIIGDSYERVLLRSRQVFGRTRVMHLAELIALRYLFAEKNADKKTCCGCKPSGLVKLWGQLKWTLYGSIMNVLSFLVLVLWCCAEGYAFVKTSEMSDEIENPALLTFGTVASNAVVYIIFLFTLTRSQGAKGFLTNCVQNLMIRILEKNGDDALLYGAKPLDDWRGRVNYLSNEMRGMNETISVETRDIIQTSEARTSKQIKELEQKMQQFQNEIITQVRELFDESMGPKTY